VLLRRFQDWFSGRSGGLEEQVLHSIGWVYACSSKLAETAGLISLAYFDRMSGEGLLLDPDPLSCVFDGSTGESLSHGEILSRIVMSLCLFGRAAMYVEKIRDGLPVTVTLWPGTAVRRNSEGDWELNKAPVPSRDLIIFRNYHPSYPDLGVPPYFFARMSLEELYYIHRWNRNFFRSGMRPDVVIRIPQRLSAEQRRQLRNELLEEFSGVDKGNSFFVITGLANADVHMTGRSEKDVDFREGQEFTREEICSVYGVPPALVGVFRYANYANSSAQMRIFWHTTVLPRINYLIGVLERALFRRFWPEVEVRADIGQVGLMLMSVDEMSAAVERLIRSGYTYDEVAEILNYPSLSVSRAAAGTEGAHPQAPASSSAPSSAPAEELPEAPEGTSANEDVPGEAALGGGVVEKSSVASVSSGRVRLLVPFDSDDLNLLRVVYEKGFLEDYSQFYQQFILEPAVRTTSISITEWKKEMVGAIVQAVRRTGFPAVDTAFWSHALGEALRDHIEVQYQSAVVRVFSELEGSVKSVADFPILVKRPNLTTYLAPDQIQAILRDVDELVHHIKHIGTSQVDCVINLARSFLAEGLTVHELQKRLLEDFVGDRARTLTWSRDISGTVYNRGRFAGFQARGVTHHRWVNSRDAYVRESHVREAGSAPVVVGEPFPITMCRFPHDPAGRVEETVNCRCTTVATAVRKAEPTAQPQKVRPRPVQLEVEMKRLLEEVQELLSKNFDVRGDLGLADLSPKELSVLHSVCKELDDYNAASSKKRILGITKLSEGQIEDFVKAATGEDLSEEAREAMRKVASGKPLRDVVTDIYPVRVGFNGFVSWIKETSFGNTVNGLSFSLLERMYSEAPELVSKRGLFIYDSRTLRRGFHMDDYVSKMGNMVYARQVIVEQFRSGTAYRELERVLDGYVYPTTMRAGRGLMGRMAGDPSALEEIFAQNHVFVRSASSRSIIGDSVPPSEVKRFFEDRIGNLFVQGYSPLGPTNFMWSGDVKLVYRIPREETKKFLEENLLFWKIGYADEARGLQIVNTTEQELPFKGRFVIENVVHVEDYIYGDTTFVWLRPATEV